MLLETPTITQLSQIIAQATAPTFLLGAVAAFISVLMARTNRLLDRSHELSAIDEGDPRAALKADIPWLRRRARLLNSAILFSAISAIITTILVILAFISAFLSVRHEYGVAVLFILALGFFAAGLVNLAREARVAMHELKHIG